jgi:hypothetical protein
MNIVIKPYKKFETLQKMCLCFYSLPHSVAGGSAQEGAAGGEWPEDDPSDDEGSDKRVSKRPRSKSTRYPETVFESPCKTGYAKVFLQNVKL